MPTDLHNLMHICLSFCPWVPSISAQYLHYIHVVCIFVCILFTWLVFFLERESIECVGGGGRGRREKGGVGRTTNKGSSQILFISISLDALAVVFLQPLSQIRLRSKINLPQGDNVSSPLLQEEGLVDHWNLSELAEQKTEWLLRCSEGFVVLTVIW